MIPFDRSFLDRYADDDSEPGRLEALRDFALRGLLPTVVLLIPIYGLGLLITGPWNGFTSEESVNRALVKTRTPFLDAATHVTTYLVNTGGAWTIAALAVAIAWWRTRQWWFALVPLIALFLEEVNFVACARTIERARPHVDKLDVSPPTSSYPSGHVGAAGALFFTFAFMAARIERDMVRRVTIILCAALPFLVAYARLYRGMHHVTDVSVGIVNGLGVAIFAWLYLRRGDG